MVEVERETYSSEKDCSPALKAAVEILAGKEDLCIHHASLLGVQPYPSSD